MHSNTKYDSLTKGICYSVLVIAFRKLCHPRIPHPDKTTATTLHLGYSEQLWVHCSPSNISAAQKGHLLLFPKVWALKNGAIGPTAQCSPGSATCHLPEGNALFLLTVPYGLLEATLELMRPSFLKWVQRVLFRSFWKPHAIFGGLEGLKKAWLSHVTSKWSEGCAKAHPFLTQECIILLRIGVVECLWTLACHQKRGLWPLIHVS